MNKMQLRELIVECINESKLDTLKESLRSTELFSERELNEAWYDTLNNMAKNTLKSIAGAYKKERSQELVAEGIQ